MGTNWTWEVNMEEGLKYKIRHIGDIFVDNLEKVCGIVSSSTKGISLTYDIHDLEKKRKKALREIGARIAEVRKASPELDVFSDAMLMELFSKLDGIDERIEARKKQREERLNPAPPPAQQFENG
jgi:hypothetical protein